MKQTILITLLGSALALAAPSLSFADSGYKFQSKALERDHRYKHKHGHKHNHNKANVKKDRRNNKNRQFVYNKQGYDKRGFNKYGYNRQGYNKHGYNKNGYNRHGYNKRGYNRHGYNKHKQHVSYQNNKPSFSISWNVGDSTISYGNDHYVYNQGYNNHNHKKFRGKKINQRLNNQARRIQNGVHSGQLVNKEVRKLRREQSDIKRTFSHYRKDGHLNRYERNKLNRMLDVASQNIHRKSNNQRTRYSQRHNNNHNFYVQY